MKRLLITIMVLAPFFALSQKTEGVITYKEERKIIMNFNMGGMEELKEQISKMSTSEKLLLFNKNESLYKNLEKEEDQTSGLESGGQGVVIKKISSDNLTFRDIRNKKLVERKDFMGKKFLINTDNNNIKWKITGESKEILGYACQKAILKGDTIKTFAWFAPSIPVPAGPDTYGQLPGLILKVDFDEGKKVITAQNIQFKRLGKNDIKIPTKGKNVTKEEFIKIVEKKMKEMDEMYQNSGSEGEGNVIRIKVGG